MKLSSTLPPNRNFSVLFESRTYVWRWQSSCAGLGSGSTPIYGNKGIFSGQCFSSSFFLRCLNAMLCFEINPRKGCFLLHYIIKSLWTLSHRHNFFSRSQYQSHHSLANQFGSWRNSLVDVLTIFLYDGFTSSSTFAFYLPFTGDLWYPCISERLQHKGTGARNKHTHIPTT